MNDKTDFLQTVYSSNETESQMERQSAKKRGRKRRTVDDVNQLYVQWIKGELNIYQAAKRLNVSRGTLYNRFKEERIRIQAEIEDINIDEDEDEEPIDFGY